MLEFTREFAQWSPERFVRTVFVGALRAALVVVGADTRFGHRNSGDVATLRELGAECGFDVEIVPEFGLGPAGAAPTTGRAGAGRPAGCASCSPRGRSPAPREVLGRPHRVAGVVVHGDHRGRELGYPTANLARDAVGQVPADGVYAGRLVRPELPPDAPDAVLPAAVSVGTNPTFDGLERRVEAYVLDRDRPRPVRRAAWRWSSWSGCARRCGSTAWTRCVAQMAAGRRALPRAAGRPGPVLTGAVRTASALSRRFGRAASPLVGWTSRQNGRGSTEPG